MSVRVMSIVTAQFIVSALTVYLVCGAIFAVPWVRLKPGTTTIRVEALSRQPETVPETRSARES